MPVYGALDNSILPHWEVFIYLSRLTFAGSISFLGAFYNRKSASPLHLLRSTYIFPSADEWKDSIICLEDGMTYGLKLAGLHSMRGLATTGMFRHATALVLPRLPEDVVNEVILKVLHEEGLYDLPVLVGVEFGHSRPMTVLPVGVAAEVDCDNKSFSVLESGVV